MKESEYLGKLRDLGVAYEKAKGDLAREFAESTSTFDVGDIISHYSTCIKIKRKIVSTQLCSRIPEMQYQGPVLTKKMEPRKDGERGFIYQSDAKLHTKSPVAKGVK